MTYYSFFRDFFWRLFHFNIFCFENRFVSQKNFDIYCNNERCRLCDDFITQFFQTIFDFDVYFFISNRLCWWTHRRQWPGSVMSQDHDIPWAGIVHSTAQVFQGANVYPIGGMKQRFDSRVIIHVISMGDVVPRCFHVAYTFVFHASIGDFEWLTA